MDFVQGKGLPLIGFLIYRSHGGSWEIGFLGSIVVLSRGALDELLDRIVRRELKLLHPCIIFLGLCLVFLFVSFRACGLLLDKLEFIENGVHMHLL